MSTPFDTDIAKYTSTSDPSLMSWCASSPGGNRTKSPGPISVNPVDERTFADPEMTKSASSVTLCL